MPPRAKGKAKIERATHAALENALREERLALAAIVKVFLLEVPDPERVLARMDAMVRAAEQNPRTPATVRRQLLDATRFIRTAIQRELGRPQELFTPHVGHVSSVEVDKLVTPTEGPQQLGLAGQESMLGDVEAAHEERVSSITRVHAALVTILREGGAATDRELHARYIHRRATEDLPWQSPAGIKERRKELTTAGRVVSSSKDTWDVVERDAITA